MKTSLVLLIAAIGLVMVPANGHFDDKLKMALKTLLLQGEEELNLESRDTKRGCISATNNCNDHGDCVEDWRGDWYCKCEIPYTVGGAESSCLLSEDKRGDLEMEIRDSLARCKGDANKCDDNKLKMALKTLLQGDEELNLESRDTRGGCMRATKNCNDHGDCVEDRRGEWYCQCETPAYTVGGAESSCYPKTKLEMKYLIARDQEQKMQVRVTLAQCNLETNSCDGFGECVKTELEIKTGEFICSCIEGYENNLYGGCSPRTESEMEYGTMIARDQELEMQARDTLARCNGDTNSCDGFGQCVKSEFGRGQFICICNEGYENNRNGGCSPKSTRDFEIDDEDQDQADEDEENDREFKINVLRRLADLLKE